MYLKTARYFKAVSIYESPSTILFVFGCVLYYLANLLEMSIVVAMYGNGHPIMLVIKMLRYFAYIVLLLKIVFYSLIKKNNVVTIAMIFAILFCNYVIGLDKTLLFYMLLLLASEGIKADIILKVFVYVAGGILSAYIILSRGGIVTDYILDKGTRNRHFLGFSWTTSAPILFLFIILCVVYLNRGKIDILEYGILSIFNLYFFIMTNTKLAFLISFCSITFFFLFKNGNAIKKITLKSKWILVFLPLLLFILSFVSTSCYDSHDKRWRNINELLTGRLELGKNAIDCYGIKLFGNKVDWIGYPLFSEYRGEYNYVDSSYIRILVQFGVLVLLLILVMYSAFIYMSITTNKVFLTWILVFICVFSLTEPRLINLTFNPFPLILLSEYNDFLRIKKDSLLKYKFAFR